MKIGMNQRNEINIQTINYLIKDDLPFLHNIVVREEDLNYYENPIKEEFIQDSNLLPNLKKDEIPTYKFESIEMNNLEANYSKVILLVGKTGDGKTTWINFLINALLGVRFEDNYRFKMIVEKENDQTKSITRGVHEYNINIRGYLPIKIIDCQGFGDTNGITEDKKLVSKLKDLFDSIKRIDCICYVIKEGDLRLDGLSKYIYHSIVSLFGKNVQKNFVFLATFSNFDTKLKNDMLKN
jgi:predicted GTPase